MGFLLNHIFLLMLNIFGFSQISEVKLDPSPDVVEYRFDPALDAQWENFKNTYRKSYAVEDEPMRRTHFEANFKIITEHNQRFDQGMHSFNLGLNEFADMVIHEFVKTMNGLLPGETIASIAFVVPPDADIPDSMDWRDRGAVTPVKNQGQCGSCYAFSATGSLEGQDFLRHGKLTSLSEQNIVDCSTHQGNDGCAGGMMNYAFEYVEDVGLDSEESYPYRGKEGDCLFKRRSEITSCYGYSDIDEGDEAELKAAVGLVGPISVGIDASHQSFQLYSGGIYDEPECSSTNLDHGVLAVGYGTENGTDYWIVKNSWGTSWGENGYIRMSRNKNNQCGIATQASFPVLLKTNSFVQ